MNDTAAHVVRETLDKYGLEKEDAHHYCLTQVTHAVLVSGYLPFFALLYIVTNEEVTIENYFPEVGNIPRGQRTRGIFPTEAK